MRGGWRSSTLGCIISGCMGSTNLLHRKREKVRVVCRTRVRYDGRGCSIFRTRPPGCARRGSARCRPSRSMSRRRWGVCRRRRAARARASRGSVRRGRCRSPPDRAQAARAPLSVIHDEAVAPWGLRGCDPQSPGARRLRLLRHRHVGLSPW